MHVIDSALVHLLMFIDESTKSKPTSSSVKPHGTAALAGMNILLSYGLFLYTVHVYSICSCSSSFFTIKDIMHLLEYFTEFVVILIIVNLKALNCLTVVINI